MPFDYTSVNRMGFDMGSGVYIHFCSVCGGPINDPNAGILNCPTCRAEHDRKMAIKLELENKKRNMKLENMLEID